MILQTTQVAQQSTREPRPIPLPPSSDLANGTLGEQAVIIALQAVANYQDPNDFVEEAS